MQLEERLKRVESSINSSSSSSSPSGSTQETPAAFHHITDLPAVADVRTGLEGYVGPLEPGVQVSTSPLFSSGHLPPPTPPSAPGILMSEFESSAAVVSGIQARSNPHPFPRIVFVPLPPQFNVNRMLQATWEALAPHSLLFPLDDALGLVGEQYAIAGSEVCGDSPARWAIVNCLVATAMLHKVTNDYLGSVAHLSWGFFKNAFAMFPELITQGDDIMTCEALLAMALFTRTSADARTTTQLVSAACRVVHSLGLHKQDFYQRAEPSTITRAKRVIWTARYLDTEMAHKYGPALSLSDIDAPLMEMAYSVPEDQQADYLEKIAQLSSIQARVDKMLHSPKTMDAGLDLVQTVLDLHQEIHTWKGTLPAGLQLPIDLSEPTHTLLPMVYMNYYSTRINAYMILARLRRPSPARITQIMRFRNSSADSTIESFWDRSTCSARSLIEITLSLPTECFCSLWYIHLSLPT